MLENELKNQNININKDYLSEPRKNYIINNEKNNQNKVIFQNDILAEKVQVSSVEKDNCENMKKNIKKKKKKKRKLDKIELEKKHDNSDIIHYNSNYYKSYTNNNKNINKINNIKIKTSK